MASIRYIAIMAEDPERLAQFYRRYLDLAEIARSPNGDLSLTDSFYNVTLFKAQGGRNNGNRLGLHHLGFEVENLAEVEARYRRLYPSGEVVPEPGDVHHGTLRIHDPDGIPVSLSETGFGVTGPPRRLPRIRHVAFATPNPTKTLEFYQSVLGLAELPTSQEYRSLGKPNRFAGDGATNFAMHPDPPGPGQDPRPGFNHVGFLVADLPAKLNELEGVVHLGRRPADRPYAEFRFKDPEGNAMDLSQTKGWEVAAGHWERGVEPAAT